MNRLLRVLIIDDSEIDSQMIERHLVKAGVSAEFVRVWNIDDVTQRLENSAWNLVLCDHFLPGFQSEHVLRLMRDLNLEEVPFVLVSGLVDTATAVATIRNGANDFIFKDDLSRLVPAIEQALDRAEIQAEKRRAEEKLRKSNAELKLALKSLANTQNQLVAVERFRALGQMSSGIAHDFNNSLTKMLGTVDLLERKTVEDEPLFTQLKTQIDDAAAVVRRLCDFYRENPAKNEAAVDISELFEETRQFTKPRWSNRSRMDSVQIDFRVDAEPNSFGWANASALREVLTNLVFNSCDAMEKTGGEIWLRSRILDEAVEIEVRDTGEGMTPEVLNHCLEPLYSTKGEKGTGLGLSIVNGVIQSFGGQLRVESERGVGTSVFVRLQKAEIDFVGETVTVATDRLRDTASVTALVVDDEPMITLLLKRQLEMLGHDVECVTDPCKAFELVQQRVFDLVISDRSMPQMSGDELALKVREVSPETKFAMASGYGDLMIANNEIPVGVDLILPKPISGDSLGEAVATLFDLPASSVVLAS